MARSRARLIRLSHSEALVHIEAIKEINEKIGRKYIGTCNILDYEIKRKIQNEIIEEVAEYISDNSLIQENGAFYVEEENY